MDYRQSVTLLRKNKRAQVDALKEAGFDLDYETARAVDFPRYLKWAKGILDISLAVDLIKGDGEFERQYLTVETWNSPNFPKNNYEPRGVRIRAYGQSFVLSGRTYEKCQWGNTQNTSTLHKFGWVRDNDNNNPRYAHDFIHKFVDCDGETTKIIEEMGDYNSGNYAAKLCREYKAYEGDTTKWSLPTYAQLVVVRRCRSEVAAAYRALYNRDIFKDRQEQSPSNFWWTCCKLADASNSNVLAFYLQTGGEANYGSGLNPMSAHNVTPISVE